MLDNASSNKIQDNVTSNTLNFKYLMKASDWGKQILLEGHMWPLRWQIMVFQIHCTGF